jgi:OmpA-OmpF porin, OOP family
MAMNFMDLVKPYLTQAITQKAASWLGESESGVGKAMGAILPTLMGTVLHKADQPGFLNSLSGLLGDSRLNTSSVLGDVGSLFGANTASSPVGQLGGSFLTSLFGDKMGAITQAIGSHAGIGAGSVGKLLGAAAPMLLALLGKQSASAGGLSSVLGMLGGQKSAIMGMIPGALGSVLGMSGAGAASAPAAASYNAASSYASTAEKSGGFPLWLIPLLALLGLGAWWFLGRKPADDVAVNTTTPAPIAAPVVAPPQATAPAPVAAPVVADPMASTTVPDATVTPTAPSVFGDLGTFAKRMLPGNIELNLPANGIETKLIGFIDDASKAVDKTTWFDFDRILFDTGAATLRSESNEQIGNIAAILKAYPNVKLKIGGYTDSTGDATKNLTLSQDRADAVMDAIVAQGVDAARLASEGYGVEHPIADNATDEGRQKNRRVSVRVTAK